ncbi:MAG: serine/threonine-protein kinase [Planctomycetota bacterium]
MTHSFTGTKRFEVLGSLGEGGMGAVYEVLDRDWNEVVALKTLLRKDPTELYRLKREFRSLADVSHPNLVPLYELFVDEDLSFFTMELVRGEHLVRHLVGEPQPKTPPSSSGEGALLGISVHKQPAAPARDESDWFDAQVAFRPEPLQRPLPATPKITDWPHVRDLLGQLADAVHFLHERDLLHRDLKPSNVLVTEEGRVVVLDFGLVWETALPDAGDSAEIVGTPSYMPPEQAFALPVSAASDWYSLGVILHEILTGSLPPISFSRGEASVAIDAPAPVPADLVDLCRELLEVDPAKRPGYEDIMSVMGRRPSISGARMAAPRADPEVAAPGGPEEGDAGLFVGRAEQLATLERALDASRQEGGVTVYVRGFSGMGKTALINRFRDLIGSRALVLAGRCYEQESVPYKALDGVIDSLSRFLFSRPPEEVEPLLPRDMPAAARLFPVLRRVESLAQLEYDQTEFPEPRILRQRAFGALRDLLRRLADRHTLVLFIDDIQWADIDSTMLLDEILRPPDAPRLLLLAALREEEIERQAFLREFLARTDGERVLELAVEPLGEGDSADLARHFLESDDPSQVEAIVQEAGGSPFLVEELARYAGASLERSGAESIGIGEMIEARLDALPDGARALMETVAVAGRPVDVEIAGRAAGVTGHELPLVVALRSSHFLRTSDELHRLEPYHDRLRESLARSVGADGKRDIHLRLAQTLVQSGVDDPESLFEHFHAAGRRQDALEHAVRAADRASEALAFDRAARLYGHGLELTDKGDPQRAELLLALAESLSNAGRSGESGEAFLSAAPLCTRQRAIDSRRRAAEQFLMGGHIDKGLSTIRSVLNAAKLKLVPPGRPALLYLISLRLRLALRGLKFHERPREELREIDLLRVDLCWAAATGLGLVDIVRGAVFQTRGLLLALHAGEPYRLARALAIEAAFSSTPGGPGRKRADKFLGMATALAHRVHDPHAEGLVEMTTGISAFLMGEWSRGAGASERAIEIFQARCRGVVWELNTSTTFALGSTQYLGEVGNLRTRVPSLLAQAEAQGNIYAATELVTRFNMIWLQSDEPERARSEVERVIGRWSQIGFHRQHYNALRAHSLIDFYEGNPDSAYRRIREQWKPLGKSLLMRTQVLRVEANYLRAMSAIASAHGSADAHDRIRDASRLAASIESEGRTWSAGFVAVVRAALALHADQRDEATALLKDARIGFEGAEMALYAAAARRALGGLLGGDGGARLTEEADEWMVSQAIDDPRRMARALVPL